MEVDVEELLNFAESNLRHNGESQEYIRSMSLIPELDYSKFYKIYPERENTIAQGDALRNLIFVNLPETTGHHGVGFVLSNTCDIELGNERKHPAKLLYAPVSSLSRFEALLIEEKKASGERKYSDAQIKNYLSDIRKQKVSQVFYLPKSQYYDDEGIVLLDGICSVDNKSISRNDLGERRVFSLSLFGWHIFMVRIAHFFTKLSKDTVEMRLKV